MTGPIDLSVIIVNWNSCGLLRDCLNSIEREAEGISVEIIVVDNGSEDGSAGMRQLLALPQPPDAVFSGSDFAAAGALQVLAERGLRVPQDMGLVGFSNELFSRLTVPQITSIDQHCELMGRSATRLLLQVMV